MPLLAEPSGWLFSASYVIYLFCVGCGHVCAWCLSGSQGQLSRFSCHLVGWGTQTQVIWAVHKGTYLLSQLAGLRLFFPSWVSWYSCIRFSQANPSRSCLSFSMFVTFGKLQTLFELISSSPKLGSNPTCATVLL